MARTDSGCDKPSESSALVPDEGRTGRRCAASVRSECEPISAEAATKTARKGFRTILNMYYNSLGVSEHVAICPDYLVPVVRQLQHAEAGIHNEYGQYRRFGLRQTKR